LYAIRILKKCGLPSIDLILVYCSIIRSILEYASTVWAALPDFLSDLIESVQKKVHVLRIIYPDLPYIDALSQSNLPSLKCRRDEACIKFIKKIRHLTPFNNLIRHTSYSHPYNLRSGHCKIVKLSGKTKCFDDFVTIRYQNNFL
jgi:hypothetical protein